MTEITQSFLFYLPTFFTNIFNEVSRVFIDPLVPLLVLIIHDFVRG